MGAWAENAWATDAWAGTAWATTATGTGAAWAENAWATDAWFGTAWAQDIAPPPAPSPKPDRGGGGAGHAFYWTPEPERKQSPRVLKKLLREVALENSAEAKKELERKARQASDAVTMIAAIQAAVRELESEIGKRARELRITYQWAEKTVHRLEDEKLILLLLLEDA
jgi:hypothetical protein